MFLVIETTGGVSVADGMRSLVDAVDAAAAAQSVAERGTWVGRRSFQVFNVTAGTAASFEATLSVLPVADEPPADVPVEDPPAEDPPADPPVEEPAPNPEG